MYLFKVGYSSYTILLLDAENQCLQRFFCPHTYEMENGLNYEFSLYAITSENSY